MKSWWFVLVFYLVAIFLSLLNWIGSRGSFAWELLGISVVNGCVALVGWALLRLRKPEKEGLSFNGIYLVLAPVGLYAWSQPELWFIAPFALAGVVILWFSRFQKRDGQVLTEHHFERPSI